MKIDRLLGIINLLLETEKQTVKNLSCLFEVSKRTIFRDLETLSKAGIPIYSERGYNGGISIMKEYKIENTFLKEKELSEILLGLKALESIDQSSSYQHIVNRFSSSLPKFKHIKIDLSGHYKDDLVKKFKIIEDAIENKNYLSFLYHNQSGTRLRKVKPFCALFQWNNWYLWGFCEANQSIRLFKLSRITQLTKQPETFSDSIPEYTLGVNDYYNHQLFDTELFFDNSVKWRVIDDYGFNYIEEFDNHFIFRFSFENKAFLIQWILSFGHHVKVLKPADIQKSIINEYEKALALYKD